MVHPAGRNSQCGFQKAHVETQLAHTNHLYAHKCIPELRKIGYQRRGKYDSLPAETLSQKKGFTQHSLHYTVFVPCRREISAHGFLFFFNSLNGGQPDFSGWASVGLTKHESSQSEVRCPSGRRCRWTSHSVLFSYFSLWADS